MKIDMRTRIPRLNSSAFREGLIARLIRADLPLADLAEVFGLSLDEHG